MLPLNGIRVLGPSFNQRDEVVTTYTAERELAG